MTVKLSAPIEEVMRENGIDYSPVDKKKARESAKAIADMLVEMGYGDHDDYDCIIGSSIVENDYNDTSYSHEKPLNRISKQFFNNTMSTEAA